ncbi:hypothetical protein GobsT_03800 [Gemmata obscuriglobus]|uniref:Uncharacterized protein n=1 Tax=Gemmata obscuriglobus TaxID=114 RepID=A0A2Z3HBC9_9BACT|nr:hypothetical protein [Gemmata obscuriglobus]AWM41026.1 hypothetical protein C1280_31265 [Gemmata obscuriglobus]QEG25653.1 hypothetical protein GobsT_03800 [Gemmata obscuriglobus]VTR99229.1 unnamed protein product [Gemmata obscuriglobus UQM 2246]
MAAPGEIILDTTLPGATRRRVWAHPDVSSHSLVVLTATRLYLAPLSGAPKAELVAAIENGGNLDELLGPLAVVVELIAVRRLRLDLLRNVLTGEYVDGGLGTSGLAVVFATPEAADMCFTKFWRRLGDGYRLQPYQRDPWALARPPLLLLLGSLLGTAVLALTLSVFEDAGSARAAALREDDPRVPFLRPEPKGPLERLLDWRVVCAAGGLVAGASQVWLYRRFTQPPQALEVTRD